MTIAKERAKAKRDKWRRRNRLHINTYMSIWRRQRKLEEQEKLAYFDRKTDEKIRLDRHLVWLINDFADYFAKRIEVGTTVRVKGVGILKIEEWTSHLETRHVMVYGDPKDDPDTEHEHRCKGAAFGFDVDPGSHFFFHGDLGAQGISATSANYRAFSMHMPEIVNAFSAKQDEAVNRLLRAFEELRHFVGST